MRKERINHQFQKDGIYGHQQEKNKPKCELQIGEVQKFNYLGKVLTEDRKCAIEIRTRIELVIQAFLKVNKAAEKHGNFVINKENSIGLRCGIHFLIWQ